MILQSQLHLPRATPTKLFYSFPPLLPSDNIQILRLFLKDLTFQGTFDSAIELNSEQLEKLKIIVQRLYRAYSRKQMTLKQMEGIWPLLTFIFPQMSGLQLYLSFQCLIASNPKNKNTQTKEQFVYQQQQYFQDGQWKQNPKFLKSLRILQRQLHETNQEINIKECSEMLEYISQYEVDAFQFSVKFNIFRQRIGRQRRDKKIIEDPGLQILLKQRFVNENYIISEPDFMHNALKTFTKEEYEYIHYHNKANTIIQTIPKIEEVQPLRQVDIQQNNHSSRSTVTLKQKSNSLNKRKLIQESTLINSPVRKINRPPRKIIAETFYRLQKEKNFIIKDMKKNRKRRDYEKRRRNRFESIQNRICYSDDEEEKEQKKQKRLNKNQNMKMYAESQGQSIQQMDKKRQDLFLEQSQQILMRRKRNIYKKPQIINYFEQEYQYDQQNTFPLKRKMIIQQKISRISTVYDPKAIGKIVRLSEPIFKPLQKLSDLKIRKLYLNVNQQLNFLPRFNFTQYQYYLSRLQGKQIDKQVNKIIIEVVGRQSVYLDIDMASKLLAVCTFQIRIQEPKWQQKIKNIIFPLLKFTIGVTYYRAISQILNNFYVSANNEDLSMLDKAQAYFATLYKLSEDFKMIGLDVKLVEILYGFMLTPLKYEKISKTSRYYPECSFVNLRHPFSIGQRGLKFKLQQRQGMIAYTAGSLVAQSLFITNFFEYEMTKNRSKQYYNLIKNDLFQMNKLQDISQWFYLLTNKIKQFYMSYNIKINEIIYLGMIQIIKYSLKRYRFEFITKNNDQQLQNQINFLLLIISDFIYKQRQNKNLLNLLNKLIMITKIKQQFGNNKTNIIDIMIYSSVLLQILKNHIFYYHYFTVNIGANYLNFIKDIKPILSQTISNLNVILYRPVFELISVIYTLYVGQYSKHGGQQNNSDQLSEKMKQIQQNIKSMRQIILTIWNVIDKKYDQYTKHIGKQTWNKKPIYSMDQFINQNQKIKDRVYKALEYFMKLFIMPDQKTSSLNSSISHYFFVLDFILSQQYFMKYLGVSSHPNQIVNNLMQIIQKWISNHKYLASKLLQRYYLTIYQGSFKMKRQQQFRILKEIKFQKVYQIIGCINATNLIVSAQKSKNQFLNPPQNSLIKAIGDLIKCDYGKMMIAQVTRSLKNNIVNLIYSLNCFIQHITDYLYWKKEVGSSNQQLQKIKNYFYKFFIAKWIKQIVTLIILASIARNSDQNIPLKPLLTNIKRLDLMSQSNVSEAKVNAGYAAYYLAIQQMEYYSSSSSIFQQFLRYRVTAQTDGKIFDSAVISMLTNIFGVIKTMRKAEHDRQPITIECMHTLILLMRWPQLLVDCVKLYWRQSQLYSNAESLITKVKVNEHNMELLLRFFAIIKQKRYKCFQINQAMNICINKFASIEITKKQQQIKQIKRILNIIRQVCKKNQYLKTISFQFLKQFLNKFYPIDKLQTQYAPTCFQRTEIYLEMMRDSLLQRKIYEDILIQNRIKMEQIIKRLITRSITNRQIWPTFQHCVHNCMIGEYSDLFDIKRLLGSMKRDILMTPKKKQIFYRLYQKLQKVAKEVYSRQIIQWCNQQLRKLQSTDHYDIFMDIQQ